MRISTTAMLLVSAVALGLSAAPAAHAARSSVEHDTVLIAVAPVSKTSAWAVGSSHRSTDPYDGLIQRWDGHAWSNSFVYAPAGSEGGGLYAVAAAGSEAWAVGSHDDDASGNTRASVLHWDGSSWNAVSTQSLHLGGNCQLYGAAALSASDVWLVGFSYPANAVKAIPVALHWDGSTLSRVAIPAPPKGQGFLSAVSATSPSNIWAVGSVEVGLHDTTLVEHWNGTSWSVVDSPNPGGDGDNLSGVYASGPTTGWAVGSTARGPLLLHLARGDWQQVRLPKADVGFELSGVSGTSDDDAWVVGDDRTGDSSATLTLHWGGRHWTRVESPTMGHFADLNGVATEPGGQTWAVGGRSVKGSDDQRPVHELWTGARWVLR